MPFNIGRGLAFVTAGKGTQLGRWHGQGASFKQQVFKTHQRLTYQRVHTLVEGAGVADLVDHTHLQMIVQILADTRQGMHKFHAVLLQQIRRANA